MADEKNLTPEERAERVLKKSGKTEEEIKSQRKENASANGNPAGNPSGVSQSDPFHVDANPGSHVKHMIGIVSGKGGVGKSSVTAMLADQLVKDGHKVGILDADITGPSIPKMYGVHGPARATEEGALPAVAENGIRIMSINLMLDSEDQPVVWRGPVIAGAVKQFWTDVAWGDLDYLLVDMPPGTGDVPLTVYQSLPLDGIIIVTSPQDLVRLIVTKAYKMAQMMKVPVLGVVENYAYLTCPDCGRQIEVFGKSHLDEVAKELALPVLGRMPIDPSYAEKADEGRIFDVENPYLDTAARTVEALA